MSQLKALVTHEKRKHRKKKAHFSGFVLGIIICAVGLFVIARERAEAPITESVQTPRTETAIEKPSVSEESYDVIKNRLVGQFGQATPTGWSEKAPGVKTQFTANSKTIALTFDACGGEYDKALIEYLEKENIPATLFVTGLWIDRHPEDFIELSKKPLFEIENHGLNHKPCSISGNSAYDIAGTKNVGEAADEIELNAQKINSLIGRKPKFYRSGTAYTDEICPQIAAALNEKVVSYTVVGDAGGTLTAEQVKITLLSAKSGDIVLMHMNKPGSGTLPGIMAAIPELKAKGYTFAKLESIELK